MRPDIHQLLQAAPLPTGQRLFALGQVEMQARAHGAESLVALARKGRAHDWETRRLERLWKRYESRALPSDRHRMIVAELGRARGRGRALLADVVAAIEAWLSDEDDPDFSRRHVFLAPIERQARRFMRLFHQEPAWSQPIADSEPRNGSLAK